MSSKYLSAGLIFIATVIVGVVLVYPKYQAFRVSGEAIEKNQHLMDIIDVSVAKGAAQKKEEVADEGSEGIEAVTETETRPEEAVFNYSVTLNAYYQ